MLLLASVSDVLSVVTSAAASIDVHASFVDINTTTGVVTPGRTNTPTIGTGTTTTVVAAPGSNVVRNLKTLSIRNRHATVSCDVTLKHTDGTSNLELFKITLLAGERLERTDEGLTVYDAAGGIKSVGRTGRYLRTTILTAGTTFTTGPDTNTIRVRMVGGGGQGGGCTIGSASISGGAGGGSAGGYAEKTFAVSPNTAYTYAIGAGGSTSGTGAVTGQVGGITTFAVGATTVTANGGLGGIGCTSAATVVTLGGAPPAVSTNGDINGSGAPGLPGFVSAVGVAVSGAGASGPFGAGGNSLKTQATGNAGIGNGSGGGGACAIGAVAAVAGGPGTGGLIMVDEYA